MYQVTPRFFFLFVVLVPISPN